MSSRQTMSNRIKCLWGTVALLLSLVHRADAASQPRDSWQTIPLMSNEVLSARLQVLRVASAADLDWMILEIANLTGKPLSIQQTWFGFDAERRDLINDEAICSGGLGSGSVFGGVITSGVVRVSSNIWPSVSDGLGCPPKNGFKVVASLRLDLMTGSGHFVSPSRRFAFNWIYPDANGIGVMEGRLKKLLRYPQYTFEHGGQLRTLFAYPEVAENLTARELLDALKLRQNTVDGRNVIASQLGRRFANDPNVVAFVSDELKKGKIDDVLTGGIWNPLFLPILLDNFEKTGDFSALAHVLKLHRGDWASNTQVVARLSAAFLRHRPLLAANVSRLGTNDLFGWAVCAHDAAVIGDRGLLRILAPALDDDRLAIHPRENEMANMPDRRRTSDHALEAIASIMDISVYRDYGLHRGPLGLEPLTNRNRAIADVKRRMSEWDSEPQLK